MGQTACSTSGVAALVAAAFALACAPHSKPAEKAATTTGTTTGATSSTTTGAPEPKPAQQGECQVEPPPPERSAGSFTVHEPPRKPGREIPSRMRTHSEGSLSSGSTREWVGPSVPSFVPLTNKNAELYILDHEDDIYVAFYRDMYGAGSCDLSGDANCEYFVLFYNDCGEQLPWSLRLNDFLSRPDRLEVQDIRYATGVLYFNEACQSYSKEAGGKCSALVAVDPGDQKRLWRTKHLVSNGEFLVHGNYIITEYGFTSEPKSLFIVRRGDGKVVKKIPLRAGPDYLRLVEDDTQLELEKWEGKFWRYRLDRWNTAKPTLTLLSAPKPVKRVRKDKRMPPPPT